MTSRGYSNCSSMKYRSSKPRTAPRWRSKQRKLVVWGVQRDTPDLHAFPRAVIKALDRVTNGLASRPGRPAGQATPSQQLTGPARPCCAGPGSSLYIRLIELPSMSWHLPARNRPAVLPRRSLSHPACCRRWILRVQTAGCWPNRLPMSAATSTWSRARPSRAPR